MNSPFDNRPPALCRQAAALLERLVAAGPSDFAAEAAGGKMFGVLVVDACAAADVPASLLHALPGTPYVYLAAFSGQILGSACHDGFVPPVYDYLSPRGYFLREDAAISRINRLVDRVARSGCRALTESALAACGEDWHRRLALWQERMRTAKARRDAERRSDNGRTEAELLGESQYMKAEYRRMRRTACRSLAPLEARRDVWRRLEERLRGTRARRSDALQRWLFSRFLLCCADGRCRSVLDIFADQGLGLPPAGTGECCAPRLLHYAFGHALRPVGIAEFWVGRSPRMEIRRAGQYYPACRGKCRPLLLAMLRGMETDGEMPAPQSGQLRIIYEDPYLLVVAKPHGMLSVAGKSGEPTLVAALRALPAYRDGFLLPVHRLDRDTAGLVLLARSMEMYVRLQRQFSAHTVEKRYEAVVVGPWPGGEAREMRGEIALPLRPDPVDRPRQVVDGERGRPALTRYLLRRGEAGEHPVTLWPATGRTHQLRVHCAHPQGLAMPIRGDALYGGGGGVLALTAVSLAVAHPVTGERMKWEISAF